MCGDMLTFYLLSSAAYVLSRGGRPGSTPPAYNHESYNEQKYYTASVVAQDEQTRIIRSRGQGGWRKISDGSHPHPPPIPILPTTLFKHLYLPILSFQLPFPTQTLEVPLNLPL